MEGVFFMGDDDGKDVVLVKLKGFVYFLWGKFSGFSLVKLIRVALEYHIKGFCHSCGYFKYIVLTT